MWSVWAYLTRLHRRRCQWPGCSGRANDPSSCACPGSGLSAKPRRSFSLVQLFSAVHITTNALFLFFDAATSQLDHRQCLMFATTQKFLNAYPRRTHFTTPCTLSSCLCSDVGREREKADRDGEEGGVQIDGWLLLGQADRGVSRCW